MLRRRTAANAKKYKIDRRDGIICGAVGNNNNYYSLISEHLRLKKNKTSVKNYPVDFTFDRVTPHFKHFCYCRLSN